MSIISVSGKIGSGKDTVGKIVQLITDNPHFTDKAVEEWLGREILNPKFQNKKWADVLKNTICLWTGCTREQLEDQEFKSKELPQEWWYYKIRNGIGVGAFELIPYIGNDLKGSDLDICNDRYLVKPTYRLLLQQVGTECGRNILHPNIWVNSLMSEYKALVNHCNCTATTYEGCSECLEYPNWVITDTRFPNELQAVKDRGGVSIKVVRPKITPHRMIIMDMSTTDRSKDVILNYPKEHESETALDNAEFDETIINDGTILELIGKVRAILVKRNIINN